MRILGINSVYHESSAAIIIDGTVVAAAEEERFNRYKHGKPALITNPDELPTKSIRFCLDYAGLTVNDIDAVAYSFDPELRARDFIIDERSSPHDWGTREGEDIFLSSISRVPDAISGLLSATSSKRPSFVPHHLAHAASAFYPSGFEDAAILVVDGIAEADCTMLALGSGTDIIPLRQVPFPHSIGFLWEKVSQYLGFSEYDACKVMGLAAYGDPTKLRKAFSQLIEVNGNGYTIDPTIANFRLLDFDRLETLFGPARQHDGPIHDHHHDVASALQEATDAALLALVHNLRAQTTSDNLCIAGGVALNCVSNTTLKHSGLFSNVFIPSAPHDAGTAIGAALYFHYSTGRKRRPCADCSPYLGPDYSDAEIAAAFESAGLSPRWSATPAQDAAAMLTEGKIVAWFQGRMEFGPRALGNRSLLADPRNPEMREILNKKVKHREAFRPFAPSVLAERASDWFDIGQPSVSHDYMLYACPAVASQRALIPAVLHVDGTARVQVVHRERNPLFHELISCFAALTAVPVVLNTSFNDSEPIVCSPADAVATFQKTRIDALFMGNAFVTRDDNSSVLLTSRPQ